LCCVKETVYIVTVSSYFSNRKSGARQFEEDNCLFEAGG
jgi:hypothetical protein